MYTDHSSCVGSGISLGEEYARAQVSRGDAWFKKRHESNFIIAAAYYEQALSACPVLAEAILKWAICFKKEEHIKRCIFVPPSDRNYSVLPRIELVADICRYILSKLPNSVGTIYELTLHELEACIAEGADISIKDLEETSLEKKEYLTREALQIYLMEKVLAIHPDCIKAIARLKFLTDSQERNALLGAPILHRLGQKKLSAQMSENLQTIAPNWCGTGTHNV